MNRTDSRIKYRSRLCFSSGGFVFMNARQVAPGEKSRRGWEYFLFCKHYPGAGPASYWNKWRKCAIKIFENHAYSSSASKLDVITGRRQPLPRTVAFHLRRHFRSYALEVPKAGDVFLPNTGSLLAMRGGAKYLQPREDLHDPEGKYI